MESMTSRLDVHSFTANHSAHTVLVRAGAQATGVNFFSDGAQKHHMWRFLREAPRGRIDGSL